MTAESRTAPVFLAFDLGAESGRLMAGRIADLLEDEALARQMGEAGRARAQEHFSLSSMVQHTLALYQETRARTRRS